MISVQNIIFVFHFCVFPHLIGLWMWTLKTSVWLIKIIKNRAATKLMFFPKNETLNIIIQHSSTSLYYIENVLLQQWRQLKRVRQWRQLKQVRQVRQLRQLRQVKQVKDTHQYAMPNWYQYRVPKLSNIRQKLRHLVIETSRCGYNIT